MTSVPTARYARCSVRKTFWKSPSESPRNAGIASRVRGASASFLLIRSNALPHSRAVSRPIDEHVCRSPLASRPGVAASAVVLILAWIFICGGAVFPPAAMAGPITAALAGILWIVPPIVMGPLVMATAGKLRAGDDGFEVRWLGRTRYVAYRDVAHASLDHERMVFTLKSGKKVFVQLARRQHRSYATVDPRETSVARRIHAGLQRAGIESESARDEEELSRGKRAHVEWLASIETRARTGGEYRDAALDRGALVRVATDGRADGSARAAAALLLRKTGLNEDEGRALADSAQATLAPRVRVALEAAADPALEEEVVVARVRAAAS